MSGDRSLFGARFVSSFLPDGEAYIVGDFEKPADWDQLPLIDRLRWMVDNGQVVAVKNIEHLHSQIQRISTDRGMG